MSAPQTAMEFYQFAFTETCPMLGVMLTVMSHVCGKQCSVVNRSKGIDGWLGTQLIFCEGHFQLSFELMQSQIVSVMFPLKFMLQVTPI